MTKLADGINTNITTPNSEFNVTVCMGKYNWAVSCAIKIKDETKLELFAV
jgi:hypothetical protein